MSTPRPAPVEPTGDEHPPARVPPRGVTIAVAVLTVVGVGALSLVPFVDDLRGPDDEFVAPALSRTADDFERADADDLATGRLPWDERAGDWAVVDRHAALVAPGPSEPAGLAVLPTDGATLAAVTALAVEPGWAFAFRVVDADDHWRVAVDADGAAWVLQRVVAGRVDDVAAPAGPTPRDGDRVEVRLVAERIEVTVGGTVVAETVDPTHAEATDVALLSVTPDNVVSMAWDDVTVE